MISKRIPTKVTYVATLDTLDLSFRKKLRIPFLLLFLHGVMVPPVACQRYPYSIASIQAVSYDHPILSTEYPLSSWMISKTALRNIPPIERACASELLAQYATTLSPPFVSSAHVNFGVEDQIRRWHSQGMTKEKIQAYIGVSNMKEVREELRKRWREEISYDAFMGKKILRREPTPMEVEHYYERYFSAPPPPIPSKVVMLQLAYYPSAHHSLEEVQNDLNTLYHELQQIQSIFKRKEAFLKAIQENLASSRYSMKYGYLSNSDHYHELILKEIPKETEQAILRTGIRALTPGVIAPPHVFTDKNGFQGVRIVLIEVCTEPRLLNLTEDYPYLHTLCRQAIMDSRLIDWCHIHRAETDIYG